jgi:succinate-semialdehyde dehydrogenase / glutarate-semialdehyde dehydrogenase
VSDLYADRAAELGAIITREMGKTTAEAAGELEFTVGIYRYYVDNGADLLKDEPLQSNTPGSAWVRKSPIDLPSIAKAAAAARMENGGQACNAAKRLIVTDDVYEDFMSEFTAAMSGYTTGDPTDPSVAYGPLSSENAARNLMAQIDDAIAKGATVHLGGHRLDRPGAFVEATVLSGVTPEMRAYREELFGPAAVVYKVSDADEAVELANSSSYGLGGAVFSDDEKLALDVADRLDVGMVWINQPEGGGPELPFGGTKRSGVGRELGPLGIDEFVNKKLIHTTPNGE